jgi:hypothetical protein
MELTHTEFTPAPLPAHIRRRKTGECIGNAVETAAEQWPTLDYAEGLALSATTGLWFRHAWNVADDDVVVDTTWAVPGRRYIGRVIPLDEVTEQARERETYWYMDESAHPLVPDGEAGFGCHTRQQQDWIKTQITRQAEPEGSA